MKIRKLNKKGFEMQKLVGFILILVIALLLLYFTPNAFGELKKKWDDIFKKSVDEQLVLLKEYGLFNTPPEVRQDILDRGNAEQLKQLKDETLNKFDDSCNGDENFKNVLKIVDGDSAKEHWAVRLKDSYGAAVCEQLTKCIFNKDKKDAQNVGLYLERCGDVYSGVIGGDISFYYNKVNYDSIIDLFKDLTNNLQNFNDFNDFDLSAVGQYYLNKGKLGTAKRIYNSNQKSSWKLDELNMNDHFSNGLFIVDNSNNQILSFDLDKDYLITLNPREEIRKVGGTQLKSNLQAILTVLDNQEEIIFNCPFDTSDTSNFPDLIVKLYKDKKWYDTICSKSSNRIFNDFLILDIAVTYNGKTAHKRGVIVIPERG